MPDLTARIAELQSLHYKKVEKIAHSLGLEKPEEIAWDDFAPAIAEAEASQQPLQPEPIESTEPIEPIEEIEVIEQDEEIRPAKPIYKYPTEWYQASGIPYCEVCGERYLSDRRGPVCPESRFDCPRRA